MSNKADLQSASITSTALIGYLEDKACTHMHYKIYTCADYLSSWFAERALYLSNGRNWNDVEDSTRFNPPNSSVINFGICFSYSKSENVAMWMLYGGMQQRGTMIDFTQRSIKAMLDIQEIEVGSGAGSGFTAFKMLKKPDFNIFLSDILYCSLPSKDNTYTIKRSDARMEGISAEILDPLGWRQKAYPWFYENECRLVVSIDKNKLPGLNPDSVKLSLGDTLQNIKKSGRIYCSPNNETDKYLHSTLQGKINWNLCGRCSNVSKTENHFLSDTNDSVNENEVNNNFAPISSESLYQILVNKG